MMRSQHRNRKLFPGLFHILWPASLMAAVLSGLAHLPFAVRYGLVDWDNRASLWHYYAAAALLMLSTYAVIIWWRQGRGYLRLTPWGMPAGGTARRPYPQRPDPGAAQSSGCGFFW